MSAGFVLFTEDASFVVPLDPAREVQRWNGWLIADPQGGGRVIAELSVHQDREDGALRVPYCVREDDACGGTLGDQAEVVFELDASGSLTPKLECGCIRVDGLSNEGAEAWEALLEASLDDWERDELGIGASNIIEYMESCLEEGQPPVTEIVGGIAYRQDMYTGAPCGGSNVYGLETETQKLRETGTSVKFEVGPDMRCVEEMSPSRGVDPEDQGMCSFGEEDCCEGAGEGMAARLVSGQRMEIAGDVTPMGGECSCVRMTPLSAETCASPFDPCGTGEGFDSLVEAGTWWAATDGSAALGIDDGGTMRLFSPGRAAPIRTEALLPLDAVVGVEFVPVVPDKEVVVPLSIAPAFPTADTSGAKGSWGNACFKWFKEGKLDQAEAACIEGLLETADSGEVNVRASLLYSLGRILEARGEDPRADALYERSLELRPGNAEVKRRLARESRSE